MKAFSRFLLLMIGLMLFAMAFNASGQTSGDNSYTIQKVVQTAKNEAASFNALQSDRKFMIVEYFPGTDSVKAKYLITSVRYVADGTITYQYAPGDSAVIYIPKDPARKMRGTVTWKYADQIYDTTFTLKETIDDPSTTGSRWAISNIQKAANSTKPDVYNKSFSFVSVTSTASSAKFTSTMDRIELFSEHWQGHGYVKIFVDGQQVATLFQGTDPYITDFKKMSPGWYYNFPKATPTSPAKEHTVEFRTDPGNQYIIDMIRTFTYTLKPR